jgi:hypothetical protein
MLDIQEYRDECNWPYPTYYVLPNDILRYQSVLHSLLDIASSEVRWSEGVIMLDFPEICIALLKEFPGYV